jgi:very-short-patch-repair endonuclease
VGKKLTLEQARQQCIDNGFEPLFDEYINNKTKILVRCKCGNQFYVQLDSTYRIKSCGHCNDPKVGDKFGKLTVIEVIPSPTKGCSVKCKCDCGRLCGPYVTAILKNGHTKSCGHCHDPKIGDKFGSLTVIEVIPSFRFGCRVKCKCDCGTVCESYTASYLKNGDAKSCGHCNDPKIGDRFGRLTVIEVIPSPANGCSVKCQCDCGNTLDHYNFYKIKSGNTKSCGHCDDPKIGDKFDKLTVIKVISSPTSSCSVQCQCDCGELCGPYKASCLKNGYAKSCGHCNDPKIGDKFGRLTVTEVIPSSSYGCSVKCQCDCGKSCGPYHASTLNNGHTKSCGNCQLLRNGRATSYIAIELHDIIEKTLNQKCKHNYYINGKCVDIVCPQLKIAVEFDGYYWHRVYNDTTESEFLRDKSIKKAGYKLLRIRSGGRDIPTEKQLRKVLLNHFEHGYNKWTITMKSWKEAKKRGENG